MAATSNVRECRERLSNMYRPLIIDDTDSRERISCAIARNSCSRVGLRVPPMSHRPAADAAGKINSSTTILRMRRGLGSAPRLGSLRVRQSTGHGSPIDFPRRVAAPQPCASVLTLRLCSSPRRAGISARLRLGSVGTWGLDPRRPTALGGGARSFQVRIHRVRYCTLSPSSAAGRNPLSVERSTFRVHQGRRSLPRSPPKEGSGEGDL
jgi:hypothetical protein